MAENPATVTSAPQVPTLAPETILHIFNLAKVGMARSSWRPAPRMSRAFHETRDYLRSVGLLPTTNDEARPMFKYEVPQPKSSAPPPVAVK